MFLNSNPQLNKNGELHHLLSMEGLPAEILKQILDTAQSFVGVHQREVKKVPLLRGKVLGAPHVDASRERMAALLSRSVAASGGERYRVPLPGDTR